MNQYLEPGQLDRFERAREAIWGTPGFERRKSTLTADGNEFFPSATWVIQTVITDDAAAIFLEIIDRDGGQRIYIPTKVARTLFRQYTAIMKARRSARSKRGSETARARGHVPFGGKTGNRKERNPVEFTARTDAEEDDDNQEF